MPRWYCRRWLVRLISSDIIIFKLKVNMKRTFLSLLALIAMGSSVMAGDTPVISVADVYARPGDVVSFSVSVNLEGGKADTYTAMTL